MALDSLDRMEALLRRVEAGELDALTAEEVEALEVYLNETPGVAERLADVRTAGESEPPGLQRLGGSFDLTDVPMPTADEWEGAWNRIEAGTTTTAARPRQKRSAGRHVLRLWSAFTAAAACVALLLTWHFATPAGMKPAAGGWVIQLADQVEVDELDVYGDATAFVDFNDDGTAMIWVFEGGDAS